MIIGLKGSLLDLGDLAFAQAPAPLDFPVQYSPVSMSHLIIETTPKPSYYIAPALDDTLLARGTPSLDLSSSIWLTTSYEGISPLVIDSPLATSKSSLLDSQEDHRTKNARAPTIKMISNTSDISETSRKRSAEDSPVAMRGAKRVKGCSVRDKDRSALE